MTMPNKTSLCCIFQQINRAVNYQELGKKEKNLLHKERVLSVRIQHHGHHANNTYCRTEPSMTKHSRKSSHSFKVRPLVGKIQSKLLPRATLIQLLGVCVNYFKVQPEIAQPQFHNETYKSRSPNYINPQLYRLL